jgi:hypothetical protein
MAEIVIEIPDEMDEWIEDRLDPDVEEGEPPV